MIIDGFEKAFLGIVEGYGKVPVSCYDHEECINILVSSNEDATDIEDKTEEAEEYFDYNIMGSYVGDYTPLFLYSKNVI